MNKPLYVVAVPSAGSNSRTVSDVENALTRQGVAYRLKQVKDPPSAFRAIQKVSPQDYAAVAVFGGDGTVIQVLKAAYKKQLPVLILPGGTANVLARSVHMPTDLDKAISLYVTGKYIIRHLNVALMNNQPFILDLHAGMWADALMTTPRGLKKKFGVLAYFLQTIRQFKGADLQHYELTVDKKLITMDGYAIMVANEGYQNILSLPLFPWPKAGALSVVIVRDLRASRLIGWFLWRLITGKNRHRTMTMWQAREVTLLDIPPKLILDDTEATARLPMRITISPYSAMVIALIGENTNRFLNLWLRLRVAPYRFYDHFKRMFWGVPSRNYCQVAPNLYVGGQYRQRAFRYFNQWGITGIVNMQQRRALVHPPGLSVLQLPTRDHTAPTLADLTKGVQFIQQQLDAGGAVYVHCHLGEGRGPSMAIAYLVSKGMRLEDAVSHLKKYRPFVRPNKLQMRQLTRWTEEHHT